MVKYLCQRLIVTIASLLQNKGLKKNWRDFVLCLVFHLLWSYFNNVVVTNVLIMPSKGHELLTISTLSFLEEIILVPCIVYLLAYWVFFFLKVWKNNIFFCALNVFFISLWQMQNHNFFVQWSRLPCQGTNSKTTSKTENIVSFT